jgi:hypothetical protein
MAACPNCGSETVENYCAHCGQRYPVAPSVRAFVKEVADDQLGVDAKLPRTLAALFLKPGLLTSEYMAGRIARYISPFRLYLLASILFFVLLSLLSRRSDWAEIAAREMARDTAAAASSDTARTGRGLNVGVTVGGERWIDNLDVNLPWPWLDQRIERNLEELAELPPNVAMRRTWDAMIEELPKVMFLLLPVYALLLKLIYVRRKRYYVEHFVFALHVHAVSFTLFSLVLIYRQDLFVLAVFFALALYVWLAMKRVYAQGYFKTTVKWVLLGLLYMNLALFGGLLAAILALAGTGSA